MARFTYRRIQEMKGQIVILSLLCSSLIGVSQNYKLINSNRETHFIDTQSSIFSIRIDSLSSVGPDTTFYNHWILSEASGFPCALALTDSSWIGTRIISQDNGNYIFFNRQNDSIIIQSNAVIDSAWRLYNFSNGNYVEATLADISIQSVLGGLDSVKTITIQTKDTSGSNINHPINGHEFKISKANGLINTINIIDFPDDTSSYTLVGHSNPDVGTVNLTAREIYNYNIGDEFHTKAFNQNGSAPWEFNSSDRIKIILNKTISTNQDTIEYLYYREEVQISNYTQNYDPDTVMFSDTLSETFIISIISNLNQLTYEVLEDSSSFSFFSINQTHNKGQKVIDQSHYRSGGNCWETYSGTAIANPYFLEGLGGWYYNDYMFWGGGFYELVYYKKGGNSWGTPINIKLMPKSKSRKPNVTIFPNPFTESASLIINNFQRGNSYIFKLFDYTGKKLDSFSILNKESIFKRNNLNSGIYFYSIINDKERTSKVGKLVITNFDY